MSATVSSSPAMLWKTGIGLLVLCVAVVGVVMAWEHQLKPVSTAETSSPTSGLLRKSERAKNEAIAAGKIVRVHALGRLEPSGTVRQITAPSGNEGARVEKIFVREGDDVPADFVLALLDNADRRQAALLEAESRQAASSARLDQIKAGAKVGDIEAQRAAVDLLAKQMQVALREFKRAEELQQRQALSIEDLELKQWNYDRVVVEHRRAQQLLESLAEVRATDVRVAELDLKAAEAAVSRAKSDLAATRVTAPAGGRILKVHAHPGEKIADKGLVSMGDVEHMYAVAEVFEADVLRLQAGMSAEVIVDCTGERFHGEIEELGYLVARKAVLSNDPISDTDARVLEVRVRLNDRDSQKVARLSNARVEVSFQPLGK